MTDRKDWKPAGYTSCSPAGASSIEEPRTRADDPDKRCSVKDPCGNTWAIATQRTATR